MGRAKDYFLSRAKDFLGSEEGPTATEYVVMLALIVVTIIGMVTSLGLNMNAMYKDMGTVLKKLPGK